MPGDGKAPLAATQAEEIAALETRLGVSLADFDQLLLEEARRARTRGTIGGSGFPGGSGGAAAAERRRREPPPDRRHLMQLTQEVAPGPRNDRPASRVLRVAGSKAEIPGPQAPRRQGPPMWATAATMTSSRARFASWRNQSPIRR